MGNAAEKMIARALEKYRLTGDRYYAGYAIGIRHTLDIECKEIEDKLYRNLSEEGE